MPRPSYIDIDLTALAHNARVARALAGPARILAAVKADAYGHGLVACSHALVPWVDGFAVAHTEEAVCLRDAGISGPIVVLEGPFDRQDLEQIFQYNLATVLHNSEQIALMQDFPPPPTLSVWLKVDTGMHRLGFPPEAIEGTLKDLETLGIKQITMTSHLAFAEQPDSHVTRQQLQRWAGVTGNRTLSTSLMNSAGMIGHLPGDSDWMRPGYMLYGGKPAETFQHVPVKAVMRFHSQIMAVRGIAPGEHVGYGGRWRADAPSRIATIPVGYGDGYPRTADNGTPVWIDGRCCPLVGRVSMDMITVDITDHPTATVGSAVELWGPALSVDRVASHAGTIGYELMTRLPARISRRWLDADVPDTDLAAGDPSQSID